MSPVATPLPAAQAGNRPPRDVVKELKRQQAQARKEILAPVQRVLSVAGVLVACASICAVVPFLLIVQICTELVAGAADTERLWRLLSVAMGVLVTGGLLQAGTLAWSHFTDAGFQLTLRRQLAAKLSRVPLGWFTEHSSGEVKKYLQDDVEALHYLVAHARLDFVAAVTVPLVTVGYLFFADWRLALLLLLPLVAFAIVYARMSDIEGRDRMAVYTRWERRTQAATIEFADGIQVVRVFGQVGAAHGRFQESVDEQARSLKAWKAPMVRIQAVSEVLVTPVFVMLLIVVAGVAAVQADLLSATDLLPFLLIGLGLGSSLLGLGYGSQALKAADVAALRLARLQQEPELAAPSPARERDSSGDSAGVVRFEGVGFGYRSDRRVLNEVDLELRPGTITALVGPSGSGKSTLAKLLPRFYDVDTGRITISGRDIRDFSTEELYRTVGFVFQDVRLIRGTIRENLRPAAVEADDEAVERAARAAQIHDRIMSLPRGYDTEIGSGVALSGGEAQRLSIARALLADTPVLVLDEATAFADPESEAAVQDALSALVAARTVLVIAHRLHTITEVDRILVLEAGVLVEQGDHRSLRHAGGCYQRMWEANETEFGELARVEQLEENS